MSPVRPETAKEPVLAARCGAMRETSARLREHARAVCEASALLRKLTHWRWREDHAPSGRPAARSSGSVALVVNCSVCGKSLSSRERVVAAGRPTHASCYETHLSALETPLVALLTATPGGICRPCLARDLLSDLDDVFAVSARLLVRRLVRTTAADCSACRRPRLVFTLVAERTAAV